MTLRQRIESSRLLAWLLARLIGGYLWFCHITTRWTVEGRDELIADLQRGPVLLVVWHGRSLMGPLHWPRKAGALSSLHDKSPIGRVSGAMQKLFGLRPMEMSGKESNMVASRTILKRVREGVSIGLTGDGPLGPASVVKDPPLDWARAMQRPVYAYAFATRRHRQLQTWDQMLMPLPFSRGAIVFRRANVQIPRKVDDVTATQLKQSLHDLMTGAALAADGALNLPADP